MMVINRFIFSFIYFLVFLSIQHLFAQGTETPSAYPSEAPSNLSNQQSHMPSIGPSIVPSFKPTVIPSVIRSNTVCGSTTTEGGTITVTCPSNSIITSIDFASYGLPNGACGSYHIGTCHWYGTADTISSYCLYRSFCSFIATTQQFGGIFSFDPCVGVSKSTMLQVTCSQTSVPTVSPTSIPTFAPTGPSIKPSSIPTTFPTSSSVPSDLPTINPSTFLVQSYSPVIGINTSHVTVLDCSNNSYITGFFGRAGNIVDAIGIFCSNGQSYGLVGGGGGSTVSNINCINGVNQVYLRYGTYIDSPCNAPAIGLITQYCSGINQGSIGGNTFTGAGFIGDYTFASNRIRGVVVSTTSSLGCVASIKFIYHSTSRPTALLTAVPSNPSVEPSIKPSSPTYLPTIQTTKEPSISPTNSPSTKRAGILQLCPAYSATNTNNAQQNTVSCTFTACSGNSIVIATDCSGNKGGGCNGDLYIRLYDGNNILLASNDDSCGLCSVISYTIPPGPYGYQCTVYNLNQGCYSGGSCSGTFSVRLLTVPTSMPTTVMPSLKPTQPLLIRETCSPYSAVNTIDATINYKVCHFTACPGERLYISGCSSSATGDQFIRLFNSSKQEVANNDDYCGSGSSLSYQPSGSTCQKFSLHQGCYSTTTCSGQFIVKASQQLNQNSHDNNYYYSNSINDDFFIKISSSAIPSVSPNNQNTKRTYYYTGNVQVYNIPNYVSSLLVTMSGGSGGHDNAHGENIKGGAGGKITATIDVSNIRILYLIVGSQGQIRCQRKCDGSGIAMKGGFNGGGDSGNQNGGGGGGASDIRTSINDPYTRLMVAGGGGGASNECINERGGNAQGDSEGAGSSLFICLPGTTGGNQVVGGSTGSRSCGSDGSFLFGGNGCSNSGGGGGGYYGGGGGSNGGGGGGSSYCSPTLCSNVTYGLMIEPPDSSLYGNNGFINIVELPRGPSGSPTIIPSNPSAYPSVVPSNPSNQPSQQLTKMPSAGPRITPSFKPTAIPSIIQSNTVCGSVTEDGTMSITCPSSSTINSIDFASFGLPNGVCGSYSIGTCHLSGTANIIRSYCLYRNACTFLVTVQEFGGIFPDPCLGTRKRMMLQVTCSQTSVLPTVSPTRSPTSPTINPSFIPTALPASASFSKTPTLKPSITQTNTLTISPIKSITPTLPPPFSPLKLSPDSSKTPITSQPFVNPTSKNSSDLTQKTDKATQQPISDFNYYPSVKPSNRKTKHPRRVNIKRRSFDRKRQFLRKRNNKIVDINIY